MCTAIYELRRQTLYTYQFFRHTLERPAIFISFYAFFREKENVIRFSLKTEKKAVEISKTFLFLR